MGADERRTVGMDDKTWSADVQSLYSRNVGGNVCSDGGQTCKWKGCVGHIR